MSQVIKDRKKRVAKNEIFQQLEIQKNITITQNKKRKICRNVVQKGRGPGMPVPPAAARLASALQAAFMAPACPGIASIGDTPEGCHGEGVSSQRPTTRGREMS